MVDRTRFAAAATVALCAVVAACGAFGGTAGNSAVANDADAGSATTDDAGRSVTVGGDAGVEPPPDLDAAAGITSDAPTPPALDGGVFAIACSGVPKAIFCDDYDNNAGDTPPTPTATGQFGTFTPGVSQPNAGQIVASAGSVAFYTYLAAGGAQHTAWTVSFDLDLTDIPAGTLIAQIQFGQEVSFTVLDATDVTVSVPGANPQNETVVPGWNHFVVYASSSTMSGYARIAGGRPYPFTPSAPSTPTLHIGSCKPNVVAETVRFDDVLATAN